jgi:hypothetical protein
MRPGFLTNAGGSSGNGGPGKYPPKKTERQQIVVKTQISRRHPRRYFDAIFNDI